MLKNIHKLILISLSTVVFTTQANAARIMDKNPNKENWSCKPIDGQWQCSRSQKPLNIFDKNLTKKQKDKAIAHDLAWVSVPQTYIGGYYDNNTKFTKPLCKSKKTDLSYENAEYDTDGTLVASGNVEVLQCDQEIYSNNAIIHLNKKKNKKNPLQSLVLAGDVIIKQPSTGIIIRSKEIDANVDDGTYSAGKTFFRLAREMPDTIMYDKKHFSGYIRGYGESFKRDSNSNLFLRNGYITTGSPYDNDWKISAENLQVDTKTKMAYIKDGWLKIKNVPVIYIPFLSAPIGTQRKSGFLTPEFINTNANNIGNAITLPYYFNLAPNYDLLLRNIIWLKRGYMGNATFRYLTNYFNGQIDASFTPYDTVTKNMRGSLTLTNNGDFKNGITTMFKYDYVSDKNYYNDYSVGNVGLVTNTLLNREFDLNYTNNYINSGLTILYYGLIDPSVYLSNIPYAKLPEVKFNLTSTGYTPDYLTLNLDTLNTYFYKDSYPIGTGDNPKSMGTDVNVFRSYEAPKITGNFTETWGYFTPSLEIPIRYYNLDNKPTDEIKFSKSSVTSVLPIFNIDTGLYFDKEVTTSDGKYKETLAPRLFYTYIPYQNQSDIPLFDTSYNNFSYDQMFEVNQFSGYDRINNANQLAYALEYTSVNQDDGTTVASAKVGQMIYFADRKVTLCQGNQDCSTFANQNPFSKETLSPITSSFQYQVLKDISLTADLNYRVKQNIIDYQTYQLQYKDANENLFNVSYNVIANDWSNLTQAQIQNGDTPPRQETISLSTLLNLNNYWGIAGLYSYNFQQKQASDWFAALQYDHKSWAIRALMQASALTNQDPNNPTALSALNYSFFLQFELKGLGGVSNSNEFTSRMSQINGYETGQWGQ